MSDHQFYNDNEAEEILRLASRDLSAGGMSKDKLIQTAAELGISPEAVLRAEEQMVKKREADRIAQEDTELRKQYDQERKQKFYTDLVTFLITNLAMVGIWAVTGQGYFWPMWLLGAWGIGVATDYMQTFVNKDPAKFERWKRRRQRKSMGGQTMMVRSEPILNELVATNEISKLDAIKELRERLNLDLRDAKDMADQYEEKNPGVFAK